jgi:hypothetical protein
MDEPLKQTATPIGVADFPLLFVLKQKVTKNSRPQKSLPLSLTD